MPPFEFGAVIHVHHQLEILEIVVPDGPVVERVSDRAIGHQRTVLNLEGVLIPADLPAGEVLSVEKRNPAILERMQPARQAHENQVKRFMVCLAVIVSSPGNLLLLNQQFNSLFHNTTLHSRGTSRVFHNCPTAGHSKTVGIAAASAISSALNLVIHHHVKPQIFHFPDVAKTSTFPQDL